MGRKSTHASSNRSVRPTSGRTDDSRIVSFNASPIREGLIVSGLSTIPDYRVGINESELQDAFRKADHFARYNEWIQLAVQILQSIGTYRVRFEVDHDKGRNTANRIKSWKEENECLLCDIHRELWSDFLIHSNAVLAAWPKRGETPLRPMVLAPWNVRYSNKFGIEQLEYQHGLSTEDVKKLPIEWQQAFQGGVVKIHAVKGAKFRVLTHQRYGAGFNSPSMMAVFHGCTTADALAAADGALAEAARRVRIQHRLGYEIRTGPNAGAPLHHAKAERKASVKKEFNGAVGLKEFSDNFDHDIEFVALDPKFFDQRRLDTVERRLFIWSAPIGQMLMARGGIAPFLMTMLRARIESIQDTIGRAFGKFIRESMDAPGEVKVRYNTRILRDDRLAAEVMKFALTSGMASLRTARGDAGLDDAEERMIKGEESKQPAHEKMPAFDPAHGKSPGLDAKGGRPKGDGSAPE